jgi:anti-sigma28 factor (negative regulator of flagellin synthesis)
MKIGNDVEPSQPLSSAPTDAGAHRSKVKPASRRVNRKARLQRVAEVRQAIREGHFRVSATQVADAMIREATELIKGTSLERQA